MTYLLTIDPGMSTGITFGIFDDLLDEAYRRIDFWQVEGGLPGLRKWFTHNVRYENHADVIVCEKFVPLPMARSFKLQELEPIRIEGVIEDRYEERVVWQRASMMVLAGGKTAAERKRASDDVLRRAGLWLTGKDVGMKDANDVNAAQKHALSYLRSINHQPTITKYLGES